MGIIVGLEGLAVGCKVGCVGRAEGAAEGRAVDGCLVGLVGRAEGRAVGLFVSHVMLTVPSQAPLEKQPSCNVNTWHAPGFSCGVMVRAEQKLHPGPPSSS